MGYAALGRCVDTALSASDAACSRFQFLIWQGTHEVTCTASAEGSLTFTDFDLSTGAPASWAPETFAVSFAACDENQSNPPLELSDVDAAALMVPFFVALLIAVMYRTVGRV